ncbi:MAG: hypothetical protein EZS28_044549 [Streblomastix strix]|uniref:Uncharacterized protein n=1 Tax=Streblomastix strix TaxID=222440 RepID=A0A5J4TND2_9EUKA|nr:MAG: hypothetical protein EZS28_044549 [Streblomastix strix]
MVKKHPQLFIFQSKEHLDPMPITPLGEQIQEWNIEDEKKVSNMCHFEQQIDIGMINHSNDAIQEQEYQLEFENSQCLDRFGDDKNNAIDSIKEQEEDGEKVSQSKQYIKDPILTPEKEDQNISRKRKTK